MSAQNPLFRRATRTTGIAAVLVGGAFALAGPASAHVTISPPAGNAGEYTIATVSVPHGCDGSATTRVAIQVPKELVSITPTRNPFWTVSKKMEHLSTPVKDSEGNEITERVAQVVYTAKTPLPDGYRDAFDLAFQVPKLTGKTIYFPTIQTCEKGQTAWVQIAPKGADEPEYPSPSLLILPPAPGETDDGDIDPTVADAAQLQGDKAAPSAASTIEKSTDGSSTLGITGAAAGFLGLALGAAALARTRRKA
ncbi:MAG: hypothetical protein JWP74_2571 [Marmoricola sp.]|nr:hypothetical protein [Marmoricola sp.]